MSILHSQSVSHPPSAQLVPQSTLHARLEDQQARTEQVRHENQFRSYINDFIYYINDRMFRHSDILTLLCLSQIKELLNYLNLYVNLVYLLSNCTSLYFLVFNDDCDITIFCQVDSSGHPRHILGAGRPGAGLLHLQEVSGVRDIHYDSQDKLNYPGSVPSVFRE